MNRACIFILGIVSWTSLSSFCMSQESGFEPYIDKEAAALIVVSSPRTLLERIESSALVDHPQFQAAWKLLEDERFNLVERDRLDSLTKCWGRIRDFLTELDQVVLVVHRLDTNDHGSPTLDKIPKISIIMSGGKDTGDGLLESLEHFKSVLTLEARTDGGQDFLSNVTNNFARRVKIERQNGYVVVSNSSDEIEKLFLRLNGKIDREFRALSKSRAYLAVKNLLEAKSQNPILIGYFNPKFDGYVLGRLIDRAFARAPMSSVAGAGFQIFLSKRQNVETPKGSFQSVMDIDLVIRFTQPLSGFGALANAYSNVGSLPVGGFDVVKLSAQSFDPEERYVIREAMYAQLNQKDTWKDRVMKSYSRYGIEFDTVLKSSNETILLYHDTGDPNYIPDLLHIQKVNDPVEMKRFFNGSIHSENLRNPSQSHFTDRRSDAGLHYSRTQSAIREFMKLDSSYDNIVLKKGELTEEIMAEQEEYFLNRNWFVETDHYGMARFIKQQQGEKTKPGMFDLLLENAKKQSGFESFVKVEYQSNYYSHCRANLVEEARAKAKLESRDKFFEFLVRPKDESGMRLKLDSAKDAEATVKTMLLHAISDCFGTSIFLFSNREKQFRMFGQIYSLVYK